MQRTAPDARCEARAGPVAGLGMRSDGAKGYRRRAPHACSLGTRHAPGRNPGGTRRGSAHHRCNRPRDEDRVTAAQRRPPTGPRPRRGHRLVVHTTIPSCRPPCQGASPEDVNVHRNGGPNHAMWGGASVVKSKTDLDRVRWVSSNTGNHMNDLDDDVTDKDIAERVLEDAHSGDAESQCFVAIKYQHGWDGVRKDTARALHWFRQSAAQGLALALLGAPATLASWRRKGQGPKCVRLGRRILYAEVNPTMRSFA